MDASFFSRAAVVFAGGALGTGARLGLLGLVGHEVVALAVVNLVGCFILGLLSGFLGDRVTLLRLFLVVGGISAFTSWSTLALQGIENGGQLVIALLEVAFGVFFAGLGHWLAWRLRRGEGWGEPA